jgi:hypothetical protein
MHDNIFRPISNYYKKASFLLLDAIANQRRDARVSILKSVSLLQQLIGESGNEKFGMKTARIKPIALVRRALKVFRKYFPSSFNALLVTAQVDGGHGL